MIHSQGHSGMDQTDWCRKSMQRLWQLLLTALATCAIIFRMFWPPGPRVADRGAEVCGELRRVKQLSETSSVSVVRDTASVRVWEATRQHVTSPAPSHHHRLRDVITIKTQSKFSNVNMNGMNMIFSFVSHSTSLRQKLIKRKEESA